MYMVYTRTYFETLTQRNEYTMKNILIVVDMQNDFIDGALGTREARAIVENVSKKIQI